MNREWKSCLKHVRTFHEQEACNLARSLDPTSTLTKFRARSCILPASKANRSCGELHEYRSCCSLLDMARVGTGTRLFTPSKEFTTKRETSRPDCIEMLHLILWDTRLLASLSKSYCWSYLPSLDSASPFQQSQVHAKSCCVPLATPNQSHWLLQGHSFDHETLEWHSGGHHDKP